MAAKKITGKTRRYAELIEHMSEKYKLRRSEAKMQLDSVFDFISSSLVAGDAVTTPIGKFARKDKAAVKGGQKAVNHFTKAQYVTTAKPAKAGVKFTANKAMKDQLN